MKEQDALETILAGPPMNGLPPAIFFEAVEQMALAVSITDGNGNFRYVNAAFADVTGHQPADVIGKNASMLSYKSTPREVYEDLWNTISSGRIWNGVILNRRKGGEKYLSELTVVPLKGAADQPHYLGLHRDITDRHELEKRALNQKTLIESIVDSAPVAMAFLGRDGKVALDNNAYRCLMADFKGNEPAGQVLSALADRIGADFDEAMERGCNFTNVELRFDVPGRSEARWFACSGTWVRESDTTAETYFEDREMRGLLLVFHELTASRRQFEMARTKMVHALMAEQQLNASVREIIEAAIYQLQKPLNLVAAAIGVLDRQGEGTLALRGALDEALGDGNEALERLRLAIPSQSDEAVGPINMNEIVRDVLDVSTDRFLTSGVLVNWQPTPVLPKVPARANAMRTLVKSLVDNAVDAVAEPGNFRREVDIVTKAYDDGTVEISIEDKGPGLPEDLRLKVFEPFFTGWRRHRGHTGMGLTLAQQTIADQGGGITLENGSSGGCLARVTFSPRVREDEIG